jgi:hypothetical protein
MRSDITPRKAVSANARRQRGPARNFEIGTPAADFKGATFRRPTVPPVDERIIAHARRAGPA